MVPSCLWVLFTVLFVSFVVFVPFVYCVLGVRGSPLSIALCDFGGVCCPFLTACDLGVGGRCNFGVCNLALPCSPSSLGFFCFSRVLSFSVLRMSFSFFLSFGTLPFCLSWLLFFFKIPFSFSPSSLSRPRCCSSSCSRGNSF